MLVMDKERLKEMARDKRFISRIYNYCDQWCERCPQTLRCLNYVMGEEEFIDPETRDVRNQAFWDKVSGSFRATTDLLKKMAGSREIDLDALGSDQSEDEERSIKDAAMNHEIARAAKAYSTIVEDWFKGTEAFFEKADETETGLLLSGNGEEPENDEMEEALEVVWWYQHQIYVKMMKAISDRLKEKTEVSDEWDRPARDSDGSAKVALIGIDRSIAAWSIIGRGFPSFGSNDVEAILTHLEGLRRRIEKDFSDARGFIRPGFDRINFNS